MKAEIYKHIEMLVNRYPLLNSIKDEIVKAYFLLAESYENGGKLLIAGNGGSAADAEHIVGELMKGFKLPRKPSKEFADKLIRENKELGIVLAENLQGALPAIALDGHSALSTAYMNTTASRYFVLHSRSMVTVKLVMYFLVFRRAETVKMFCMRRRLLMQRE